MPSVVLQEATPREFESICALNLSEIQHTSAMDINRLATLDDLSSYHRVARVDGVVAAFLLTMGSGSPYENDNFEWFARRYPRFIYVDRVVVSSSFRGLGLGSFLYEDLFRHARAETVPVVTCEYNIVPSNEPSRLFHIKFGFEERGTQWVAGGTKLVSLQAASISELDDPVESPCVRNCCLDDALICMGCFRSLEEIKDWSMVGSRQRFVILQNAKIRREAEE